VSSKTTVSKHLVCVESRSSLNMLLNLRLHGLLLSVSNVHRAHFAATLKHSKCNRLTFSSRPGDATLARGDVHVPGLAADEGLIHLNFPAKHSSRILVHCRANAV